MYEDFYRDRRVLVTGHTGFKGAWLALWLQRLGADVTGYSDRPPTTPSSSCSSATSDLSDTGRGLSACCPIWASRSSASIRVSAR